MDNIVSNEFKQEDNVLLEYLLFLFFIHFGLFFMHFLFNDPKDMSALSSEIKLRESQWFQFSLQRLTKKMHPSL